MIKPPGIRFDRQRTSWEKVPGASFCLMTACCDQRQVRNNGTMEIPDSHKKRKNNNEMHPPPRRVFQGFLENPPPRNINLLFLSFFQGFFSAAFFAAGLRQCWQWRKTSSRSKKMKHAGSWKSRWPVTLVAWMPFPPFLLVGTWGNSSCWSWVSRGDAQSSRCSACFFLCSLFCTFIVVHC